MTELSIIFNEKEFKLTNEGDIYFWNHLITVLEEKNTSLNSDEFVKIVFDEHFKLTGEPLTIYSQAKIKNKNINISGKFWIDNFVRSVDSN